MARALTHDERETFNAIRTACNTALVQTTFDGEDTAVIASVTRNGSDYIVTPLAVLVTPAIMARLEAP